MQRSLGSDVFLSLVTVHLILSTGIAAQVLNAPQDPLPAQQDQDALNSVYAHYSASSTHYASATRSVGGVTYEYAYDNGKETLKVYGDLPESFDQEKLMDEFRKSVGVPAPGTEAVDVDPAEMANARNRARRGEKPVIPGPPAGKSRGVLEAVSDFFVGKTFTDEVKTEYIAMKRLDEHVQKELTEADARKLVITEQLTKALNEEQVLKARQADIGRFLRDTSKGGALYNSWTAANRAKKSDDEDDMLMKAYPTILELIDGEADRLSLLQYQLTSAKNALFKEKAQVEQFIATYATLSPHHQNMKQKTATPVVGR